VRAVRVVAIVGLVAGAVGLTSATAFASGPKPVISNFVATPATSFGGSLTVTASVSGAVQCVLSSGSRVSGLPVSFSCASGTVEREINIPPNATLKPTKYSLTLTAKGSPRTSKAKAAVTDVPEPVSISSGGYTACAVLVSGHIGCWGQGEYGELGNGKKSDQNAPVEVSGIADATEVSAGGPVTCAVLSTGHVDCWGSDEWGEVGVEVGKELCRNEITCIKRPVEIKGITEATQVSASRGVESDACAVLASGHIDCWGNGSSGQLGNGKYEETVYTPVEVQNIDDATEVSAGSGRTCALLSTGHVDCWGGNNLEESGKSATPSEMPGITDATAVSVGGEHACVLLSTGHIECWGWNNYGELGDGTWTGPETCVVPTREHGCSKTPVEVQGIANATQVGAGLDHTCAVLATGPIECWGSDDFDQLGTGTQEGPETCDTNACSTVPIEPLRITNATQVSSNDGGSCALLSTATVDCWGMDTHGQLGNGITVKEQPYGTNFGPVEVVGL
jgi:alpha-tubulin suppressor-like RCC1 family protein